MMTVKEKAAAFITDYNKQLNTLNKRMDETGRRLEELALEIRFIEEKEIPEAVERRVLTGDRSQENKVRKSLDKLKTEKDEKDEDLVVLQSVLNKFKQQQADEIRTLNLLFQEEKNLISNSAFERMITAQKAYADTIFKESDILHVYRNLEAELQQIEVNASRRKYVDTVFPIDFLKLASLSINTADIIKITKRLK